MVVVVVVVVVVIDYKFSLVIPLASFHRKCFDQPIKFGAERFYNKRCVVAAVCLGLLLLLLLSLSLLLSLLSIIHLPLLYLLHPFTENGLTTKSISALSGPEKGVSKAALFLLLLCCCCCCCCCYTALLC